MAPPEMLSSGEQDRGAPHVVFIPSAGMGHLFPFFRFITALSSHDVDISVVTVLPTVTTAEADHFAALFTALPRIRRINFNLLPLDASAFPGADPFFLRWESLRRSAHLLGPLLAGATPSMSAVITDVTLASQVIPIVKDELHLSCHILFPSSTTMLSVCAYFPTYLDGANADHVVSDVDVPGVRRFTKATLPQALHDPNNLFTKQFVANGRGFTKADGFLLNTFEALEPEAIAALRGGKVIPCFPPVFTVGPLKSMIPAESEKAGAGSPMAWLDEQPARSVVYVAFGNRCAVTLDQIREIAAGLEASSFRFLWVLKTTVVDREDTVELKDVLGDGFLERTQGRGLVTKAWVDQEAVLNHPAVGLFLSHSGWNSVLEAAVGGVPLLAWPRLGDHHVNATAMVSGGVGVWMEHWSWDGEDRLVSGEEIGEKLKEVMADETVRARVAKVREEAAKAVDEGGSTYRSMQEFVAKLKAN
uniref:Glycosyltransferase n=1 Tax=Indosasa hispida TaxID=548149 RepID=A0A0D3Q246_9POAL|nr:flavonoid-3-O-glucosyltransferase [Indosasa hispida]